jgi:hypothetical protein
MSDLYLPMYLQHQMNSSAYLKSEKKRQTAIEPIPASEMQNAALLH